MDRNDDYNKNDNDQFVTNNSGLVTVNRGKRPSKSAIKTGLVIRPITI